MVTAFAILAMFFSQTQTHLLYKILIEIFARAAGEFANPIKAVVWSRDTWVWAGRGRYGAVVVVEVVVVEIVSVSSLLVVGAFVVEVVVVETRGRRQGRYGAIVLRDLCHPRHHLCH